MSDWVWFDSLAFPAFFRTTVWGTVLWFFLRYIYHRLFLDRWFWHSGIVELSLLVVCCAIASRILTL